MSDYEYDDDDDEYEYDYGSDEEFYDSDQNFDEADSSTNIKIEIENAFYEGDDCRNDNPERALEMFEKVVKLENEKGDEVKWRVKALEYISILLYQMNRFDDMIMKYKEMLTYLNQVTRNECTEAINNVLDCISNSLDTNFIDSIYQITLKQLKESNNERLWFNTMLKMGRHQLILKLYDKVEYVINELHNSCKLDNGNDDLNKSTSLLEIYALEITLCTEKNDSERMKRIYPKTLDLNGAVVDPRIMGIIREQGGKMYMMQENWSEAYNEFYEAFRCNQEAGSNRAKICLRFVVLANMLALSDINPFAAREARVYQDHPEVKAMMDLRIAYDNSDVIKFENILHDKKNGIMNDPYIMKYIEPLRKKMRQQVLNIIIKPYKTVTLKYLSNTLNININQIETLLKNGIYAGTINGKIDKINNAFINYENIQSNNISNVETKKLNALNEWANALENLCTNLPIRL